MENLRQPIWYLTNLLIQRDLVLDSTSGSFPAYNSN